MNTKHLFSITGFLIIMITNTTLSYATDTNESSPINYQRQTSVSGKLPSYYPSHFPAVGVLTDIRGSYDWVVNGKGVKVSSNVIVHSLVTNFSSMYSVKQGMELAYRKNKQDEIVEVWALPGGSIDRN